MTFSNSEKNLSTLSDQVNSLMANGLKNADVWIITLGVCEVFLSQTTGKFINQYPGYSKSNRHTYEYSFRNYEQTVGDLKGIIKYASQLDKKIIFTVSPVPLGRTFSGEDIFTASMLAKSTLRAAVHSVADGENYFYFPAYEMAVNRGIDFFMTKDGRHPRSSEVDIILQVFLRAISD